jgi:DNA-binding beta-propeller fold protein YncE
MVYVVNLESYEITQRIETSSRITDAALSPDEKSLYCTQDSGIFRLDLVDGNITFLLRFEIPQTLAVNPIDSTLYVPYKPNLETAYSDVLILESNGLSRSIKNVTSFIHDMGVSADGRLLYCLDWTDGSINIIDTATLAVTRASSQHSGEHFKVFFPSDGVFVYFVYEGHSPNMESPSSSPCFIGVAGVDSGQELSVISLDDSPMGVFGELAFSR